MKKLNHILHWDNFFIEGYALFLMVLGFFHPWIFIMLACYIYWQRKNIKVPVLLIGAALLLMSFYVFETKEIPQEIHGEAKIVEINPYEYSDMMIINYQNIQFQVFVEKDIYHVGDIVFIDASVESFRNQTIPYGFNQKTYYLAQDIRGYLDITTLSFVRHSFSIDSLREQLNQYLSNFQSQMYLKAFILGEKSFTDEQNDLYKDLGILYLFTVSGLHIYALMLVIKKIFFYLSLSDHTQFFLTLLIYLVILYFNQFSMSVLRIVILFLIQYFAKKEKMNLSHLDMIHLTFFILLIYRIEWIYHLGLLMLFIILNFIDLMSHTYQKLNGYLKRLLLSVIIILTILPFQSYISPFLILLLPVIMFILTGPIYFLVILVVFIPELDSILWMTIEYFEVMMHWLNLRNMAFAPPSLPTYGIFFYYILIIYLFRAQTGIVLIKRSLLVIFLFTYFIYDTKILDEISVYMIDVGQGDSFLIESPSCNMLIDSYQNVLPLMNHLGIYELDYLILTHSDNDHVEEAQEIIDHVKVNQVIINPYNTYDINHNKVLKVKSDDSLKCGSLALQFLGPIKQYEELNNNALVFKVFIGNQTFLFTGDIESKAEQDLVLKYNILLKSDVLKVAHHGSSTSSTEAFIYFVDPDIALISLGYKNKYGFPSQEVINRLKLSDIDIYRTDTMGTIVYTYHQKKEKWIMHLPF